ncbi:unnamed protein product [Eruca vesicaria subsp. sativa]|uniref:Uncharacterized protein n=1 Tax=Eruca vesicaria subsp. sativa TaxID=29727 RepID=A0ABC8LM41_ERUVS|nr:unnamed protein product [Eruca vesicaria subsp. sativa]
MEENLQFLLFTEYQQQAFTMNSKKDNLKLPVKSIIDDPYEEWSYGADFDWVDETEDVAVNHMVCLISEDFRFQNELFKGGLTRNDLARMRFWKKHKEKEPKERLTRTTW